MPKGTCQICACTEDNACEGGCAWVDTARLHCSQCIGWALLSRPHPYKGVFEHDLVPIQSVAPVPLWNCHTNRTHFAFFVDFRRLDRECIVRMAYGVAQINGITVDEFLEYAANRGRCPLDVGCCKCAFSAQNREQAAEAAKEYCDTGMVSSAVAVETIIFGAPARGAASNGGRA